MVIAVRRLEFMNVAQLRRHLHNLVQSIMVSAVHSRDAGCMHTTQHVYAHTHNNCIYYCITLWYKCMITHVCRALAMVQTRMQQS